MTGCDCMLKVRAGMAGGPAACRADIFHNHVDGMATPSASAPAALAVLLVAPPIMSHHGPVLSSPSLVLLSLRCFQGPSLLPFVMGMYRPAGLPESKPMRSAVTRPVGCCLSWVAIFVGCISKRSQIRPSRTDVGKKHLTDHLKKFVPIQRGLQGAIAAAPSRGTPARAIASS